MIRRRPRTRRNRGSRATVALVAIAAIGLAACSSGESAITAGNDPEPADATDAPAEEDDQDDGATDDEASDDGTAAGTQDGADDDGATSEEASDGPADGAGDEADGGTDEEADQPDEGAADDALAALAPCPTDALADADQPVEIEFWHGLNVDNEDAITAVTDAYNASQDAVVVTLQNQGGYLDTIDKYYQSSEGNRPELVMFPEYGLRQAIDSDTVIPAGACIESSGFDTSAFQPVTLQAYATEGVQWGMPFNVSNPVLYYDRTVFEEAGLDPDAPPQSLDELREMSQTIVDSGAAAYGIALESGSDSGGGWFLEQFLANLGVPYADNDNGRSAPATEVLFDGPEGVALLTEIQSLVDDGLAVYVGDNATGTDQFFKLADPVEPAAMAIGTSAGLGTVLNALGGGLFPDITRDDVGVGPLPGPSGEPSAIVGGAALYAVQGQGDAEAAAAWDFVQYLTTPEVQAEWAVATGYIPLRDDALDLEPLASTFAADARFRVAYDQLTNSTDIAAAGPLLGPHREIRNETANAVAAILGGADVATTLTSAADTANAFLADYNARN